MMDYLTSMKQMNGLILESVDIQDQGFISDKESDELSSKLDDVAVPTLKTKEYIVTEDIEMDDIEMDYNVEVPVDEMPGTDYEGEGEVKSRLVDVIMEEETDSIEGAAGTSEDEVESIMGNAETLPENLGMKNSLSAKPNLSEAVIDEKPMDDAKEGSNVELKTIEHFNDVFIKEYQPQANIKYDLDVTELKTVVTSDTYKLPRGW